MRLLLTEDDIELAQSLIERFRDQGYEVVHVGDGVQGLEEAIGQDFDAIIVDRMLPGMDGLELVKAIRRQKATPILYLTTMSGIDDRVRGLEAGGDDYLIKPFAFEELLARIRVMTRRLAPAASRLSAGAIEMDLVRRTLIAANEADISTVINGLRTEGLDEAIEVVQQRLGTPAPPGPPRFRHQLTPDTFILIEDRSGKVLAGNLPPVRCGMGIFTLSLPPPDGRHHSMTVLGRCAALTDTTTVFVGRDTFSMTATRGRILGAFGWVALGTCVFSILGGLFLGRRFMARVDAITQTCERIIAGRLDERIPVRGRADEWDRLGRAINEMLDRISMLLENLQQVSSDVAHDLRTPLTRLRNRLEAAREKSTGIADYSLAISRAIEDTDQLLSMFAALLRISQIEAGTRVQTFARLCLSDLLERVYQLYLPVAEDCGHPLSGQIRRELHIRGDQELLMQMFSNLIENALRHTPRGTRVRIALELAGNDVLASVIDGGPGVPLEDRGKVTRRFYRGSASRSSEGHGLGLSLAAAIAQLHGAELALSDAAPGLRVAVALRAAP